MDRSFVVLIKCVSCVVVTLLLFPSLGFAQSQDSSTVRLDERLRMGAAHGDMSLAILRQVSKMDSTYRGRATLPDSSVCPDPLYDKLYFTGSGSDAAVEKGIMVLACGYDGNETRFYVDENNNLDFTDDGPPRTFTSAGTVDFTLTNAHHSEGRHVVRWSKIPSDKKKEFSDFADKTAEMMGIEEYTLYYRVDRRNILAGDYTSDSDSFRVALKDWDVDGLYNEAGEDRLLTGPYESEKLSSRLSEGAVELESTTYFQGGKQAYQVVSAPRNGRYIKIAPALEAKVPDRLEAGDTVPEMSFNMLDGKQKQLEDFVGQSEYLFLDFWATWCAGCHEEVETLKKLHADPMVTVLSLNYNEGVAAAAKFIEEYDIEWPNGFSDPDINQTFKVDGLPRGVLISRDGTIIDPVLSAKEAVSKIRQQTGK